VAGVIVAAIVPGAVTVLERIVSGDAHGLQTAQIR